TPLTIIYSADELKLAIDKVKDADTILVDTAGFSHKSPDQKADTRKLIASLPQEIEKEVYLVLSATTKYRDLLEICDSYREISDYKLIFTKLDETSTYGNLFNIRMYTGASMSYVTTGQNVPDDIEVFDTQRIVKRLLGGK
ncbi:MAG: flagellar biosynthesis protein FlhF, partial [Lachnospiraceae bacterium]|nr:flagellar biosynthesis protein FlhF [Lachnospiraceae bacterium]